MFTFTLAFGVITVGSSLANANANEVTSFLGGGGNNIVYVDDGTVSSASDFYQSEYNSVKEVREKGFEYSQTVTEEGAVLLKNDNNALPLQSNDKVSLFSASSAKPVVSGYREGQDKAEDAFQQHVVRQRVCHQRSSLERAARKQDGGRLQHGGVCNLPRWWRSFRRAAQGSGRKEPHDVCNVRR